MTIPEQPYELLGEAPRWQTQAACRDVDPAIFFPERGQAAGPAKAICRDCPVIEECRDWGLRHEKFGVWGGLSERERRSVRPRLRIGVKSPQAELTMGRPIWGQDKIVDVLHRLARRS